MEIFANRLKELRTIKKLSHRELAKALEVSKSVISYWETDRSEPTGVNLVKIADYFDVSVDYLLGRTKF